jgi:hypothetical protein
MAGPVGPTQEPLDEGSTTAEAITVEVWYYKDSSRRRRRPYE